MTRMLIAVASLIGGISVAHAAPRSGICPLFDDSHELLVQHLPAQQPFTRSKSKWTEHLKSLQFSQVGESTLYCRDEFCLELFESRDGLFQPRFFINYLGGFSAPLVPGNAVSQIVAIQPNAPMQFSETGTRADQLVGLQQPYLLLVLNNGRRERTLVLSTDGISTGGNIHLEPATSLLPLLQQQRESLVEDRLMAAGFIAVPGAAGYYRLELPPPPAAEIESTHRPMTVLAHVENGQLTQLLREPAAMVALPPRPGYDLKSVEIKSRQSGRTHHKVAHVVLTRTDFEIHLTLSHMGDETLAYQVNPTFDVANLSEELVFEMMALTDFFRHERSRGSPFRRGGTNTLSSLTTLKPDSVLTSILADSSVHSDKSRAVTVAEADKLAHDYALLPKNVSLVEHLIDTQIRVEHLQLTHRKMALPLMAASFIVDRGMGSVFNYRGQQFRVTEEKESIITRNEEGETVVTEKPSISPLDPNLGEFKTALIITNLATGQSLRYPKALVYSMRDGFYGDIDPFQHAALFTIEGPAAAFP